MTCNAIPSTNRLCETDDCGSRSPSARTTTSVYRWEVRNWNTQLTGWPCTYPTKYPLMSHSASRTGEFLPSATRL